MDLKTRIEQGLKEALKGKDTVRVSVSRMLLAAIKNKEIEKLRPLSDDELYSVVRTSIKQHVESIDSFRKGKRQNLVDREEKELVILQELLPSQLSAEEMEGEIGLAIELLEARTQKDTGKIVKFLMEKYPGRIDGRVVSGLVLKRLSNA
jgi:uncharacterized protein